MLRSQTALLFLLACTAAAQVFHVDDDGPVNGNGSAAAPFRSISAAVNLANNYPSAVIYVRPGRYETDVTLAIKTSVIVNGSNIPVLDSNGWPTGAVQANTEARIVGTASLGAAPLVVIGKDTGALYSVIVQNLTFEAGPGNGDVMNLKRVQSVVMQDNILTGSAAVTPPSVAPGLVTLASSGVFKRNYMSGMLFGAALTGGYAASPANVVFERNRMQGNRNGLLLIGTSDGIPEPGNVLNVTVIANDLSGQTFNQLSFGLRAMIKGNEALGGTGLSTGRITATIASNRITGNRNGVVLDGGFTYRVIPGSSPAQCDNRTFTGIMNLVMSGNTVSANTDRQAIVSFNRVQATLGAQPQSNWQYLHNASISVVDQSPLFAGALRDHPASDVFAGGPCASDVVKEPLNNTLRINGILQPMTQP